MNTDRNLRLLSESYMRGKLSHAYIIEGPGDSGKEEFADMVARAFMCEEMNRRRAGQRPVGVSQMADSVGQDPALFLGDTGSIYRAGAVRPCGQCPSCKKAASGNHPDIIHVRHEKDTVLSVGEIRDQVANDIYIKPYYGPYKIYIVADAQLMNESAQNALLKTIEEPASYGIIFLLADNADCFLQTIRSRCLKLSIAPPPRNDTARKLSDENGTRVLDILAGLREMSAPDISKAGKELGDMDRQKTQDIFLLWFRDLLVYKCTQDEGRLYFRDRVSQIREISHLTRYESLGIVLSKLEEMKGRLDASVKAEAAFEAFLLTARRELTW